MDSTITDSTSLYFINNIIPQPHILLEIIKILIPAIAVLVGSYIAFRLGLKKDRTITQENEKKRLKEIEEFLIHSIELLIPATKNQADNLNRYVARLNEEINVVRNVESDHELHLRNIESINTYDLFKLFSSTKIYDLEKKLLLLSKFNQSIFVIRDILDDFDKSNLQFHIAEDEYLKEMTNIISNIWRTYNEMVEYVKDKKLSDQPLIEFVKEVQKLHSTLKGTRDSYGNIYVNKREVIDKLKPITEKYEIRRIRDLISDFLIAYQNFGTLRNDFKEKFTTYASYLYLAHKNLMYVKDKLQKTNYE